MNKQRMDCKFWRKRRKKHGSVW